MEVPPHLFGLPSQPNFTKTTGKPAQILNISSFLKNSLENKDFLFEPLKKKLWFGPGDHSLWKVHCFLMLACEPNFKKDQ